MEILIQKAKQHDKSAFVELMRIEGKRMYKVAKAILGAEEDVADAMQETAVTCWEKINTLKKNEYFETWLIRILINYCNGIKRQNRNVLVTDILPEIVNGRDEYSQVEWMQLLSTLNEKYRMAILLYYGEGFKVKEIAQILGISESAVKSRLATGREQLKSCYLDGKERKVI